MEDVVLEAPLDSPRLLVDRLPANEDHGLPIYVHHFARSRVHIQVRGPVAGAGRRQTTVAHLLGELRRLELVFRGHLGQLGRRLVCLVLRVLDCFLVGRLVDLVRTGRWLDPGKGLEPDLGLKLLRGRAALKKGLQDLLLLVGLLHLERSVGLGSGNQLLVGVGGFLGNRLALRKPGVGDPLHDVLLVGGRGTHARALPELPRRCGGAGRRCSQVACLPCQGFP